MLKKPSSSHFIWQTLVSVLIGVGAGLLIVSFSQRHPAEALTATSTMPPQSGASFGQVQILPMLSNRMTVLVMGVDSNGRDAERFTNTRSDTMILVSMDPIARKVGIVSIPRDSRIKISGNHGMDKINAAHALGGPALSVQTVAETFGIPVDHYVVVDTQALKDLCQLLGPVEVLVEKEMHYHDWAAHLHIDLKPGLQTLTPEQVEQYVRFRHDAKGDIGRIERQQWFFRAAARKMRDPQFLLKLPELVRMAHDYVRTDLSLDDMARIATFAKDVHPEDVVTATLPGEAEMINGGSYWIPDMDGSRGVFNRMLGLSSGGNFVDAPRVAAATTSGDSVAGDSTSSDGTTGDAASASSSSSDPLATPVVQKPALTEEQLQALTSKPISIGIRYCKGGADAAAHAEKMLTDAGYNVRYKWLMPAADCQHDEVIQMSARADDDATQKLRKRITEVSYWPVGMQLDPRPICDFTLVLSPQSQFALEAVAATSSQVASGAPSATTSTPSR
jgi:LCP family protein required for cell wall assembly